MSVIDKAIKNLEEHGIEVNKPKTVRSHKKINSSSEISSKIGFQDGLEAATYNHLDDRLDIYMPLAINRALTEMSEEDMEQIDDAFDRHRSNFTWEIRDMGSINGEFTFSDRVKLSRLQYVSTINDNEVDDELKARLKDAFHKEILFDSEHELVHASHYQKVLDESFEPLDTEFIAYVRDIRNINEELSENERRKMNEGVDSLKDIELASALKFLDEERIQKLVSLAGREHKKWLNKHEDVFQSYAERKSQIESRVVEEFDLEQHRAYMELTDITKPLNLLRLEYDNFEEALKNLDEEREEAYQIVVQAGMSEQEIKDNLRKLKELNDEKEHDIEESRDYMDQTKTYLEDAIIREAELQGDFEAFLDKYAERLIKGSQVPGEFTEAFAQFWTAYREGDLDDDRDAIYDRLDGYDIEGLDESMAELLEIYDSMEGDQSERVSRVMSSQTEYLEENYDIELAS